MKPELEKVDLGVKNSILAFNYSQKDFDAPWHFHPQHELTYIRESVGTKFIGDYVGPYEAGELVLLNAHLPHCWKNHVDQSCNASSTVIQWNKDIFSRVPELSSIFEMLHRASRGLVFNREDIEDIIPILVRLPSYDSTRLYIKFLDLLLSLSACRYSTLSEAQFVHDLPSEYSSRMDKIHNFVGNHFGRKIYLKELADLVNMSEQSFSRFFSKMMGRPFITFLNEYRVNMASRMLIDTDWSVAQIGFSCGYESLPFFHKQFLKFKQETPSKYRKRYLPS